MSALISHWCEVVASEMSERLLLIPLKASLRNPVWPSLTHMRCVVLQILFVCSLHLPVFYRVRWHLVVLDIIVNLVVDGLLHHIPIGVSLG